MTTRKKHEDRRVKPFTDLWIRDKLPYAPTGQQVLWWDTEQTGLALLVGAKTKTFRCQVCLNGTWVTYTLGRYPDLTLARAREQTDQDRQAAKKGVDPRKPHTAPQPVTGLTFDAVVDRFINEHCKYNQRTWDQTERILKNNCKAWLKRPFKGITKDDGRTLLRGFRDEGKPYKASSTRGWLRKLWRWSAEEDLCDFPVMDAVKVEIEKRERDRIFADAEIKQCWNAANRLDSDEAAYVKLLMLLAPRKTSLACIERKDLDENPTLWTIPFELTKSRKKAKKRVYLVPLPPLCQRLFKGAMKDGRLFPNLQVYVSKSGRRDFYSDKLKAKLIAAGAPKDFNFHAWRHTIATYLENAGHSEWERGLVLNHSGSGSVTGDYSHGYPLELKLKLLTKWSDHIEQFVQPKGAVLLR